MKKYRVNVNGTAYEVEIELIDNTEATSAPAAPKVEEKATSIGGEAINAPMPGTILAVNVTAGQAIKKGDVLFILEAMKMENEIMAPADGTIANVAVTKGATVESGAVLCTLA